MGHYKRFADLSSTRFILGCAALIAALWTPWKAWAQESTQKIAGSDTSTQLEEVVVTAQKRTENLQRVPLSVEALSGDQLSAEGILGVNDLKSAFAGVNIRTTSSYFQPSIRGISTSSINVENPVALYIDGVYYSSQRDAQRTLDDISQITVLKGPQGTLFGRNSTAGVIQIETLRPSHEFSASTDVSYENYNTVRAAGYVTGGIAPTLSASLATNYMTQGEGWGRDITTGKDTFKLYALGSVRTKWLFEPDDTTRVTLIGDYMDRNDSLGPWFKPFPGTIAVVPGYIQTPSVYDSDGGYPTQNTFGGGGLSLDAQHDLEWARLTSISAFRDFVAGYTLDATMVPTLNYDVDVHTRGKTYTEEMQLASTQSGPFNWTFGGFYLYELDALDPEVDTIGGFYDPPSGAAFEVTTRGAQRTQSISPFAQADYNFLPDTKVTLGIRYTYEKRTFGDSGTAADGTFELAHKVTYRAALDRQFTPDILGYISYNTGFKSGGYNIANPENPSYQPEELTAYELGIKTEWLDKRLRVNTAAFFYSYTNLQVTTFTDFQNTIVNGAKAKLYGLDLDLEGQITQGLKVTTGLELLQAYFSDFPDAIISTETPEGIEVGVGSATGHRLPLAQKENGNVSVVYTTPIKGGRLEFDATENYNGDYFFEADNFTRQGAYSLVNLSTTWFSTSGSNLVRLYVRNLLDKTIIAQASALAGDGYLTTYDNPPRTYGIELKHTF